MLSNRKIRNMYLKNKNIMKMLRQENSSPENSIDSIAISYDLQTGSYIKELEDPETVKFKQSFGKELGLIINQMDGLSVLEAGVGECTTLRFLYENLTACDIRHLYGMDISWSRLCCGRKYISKYGIDAELAVGNLTALPYKSNSIDIVYTAHSIEPNRGREKKIITELYRVAKKYLVLMEPSYQFANEDSMRYMDMHLFCNDIKKVVDDLGYKVIENKPFLTYNPLNPTGLIVIKKEEITEEKPAGSIYACPCCTKQLVVIDDYHYCNECLKLFPTIFGIPCLLCDKGILASWVETLNE